MNWIKNSIIAILSYLFIKYISMKTPKELRKYGLNTSFKEMWKITHNKY